MTVGAGRPSPTDSGDPTNFGGHPTPSPVAPSRIGVFAPVDRATVRWVCAVERVTRSRGAGDREAASIMRATLACDSFDFLGAGHVDAVGTHLLRKTAGGDYCNRGQN